MNLNTIRPSDSAEFLNAIINDSPSSIFVVDKDFKIRFFNLAFKNLFDINSPGIHEELCGNAIKCEFNIKEGLDCGTTSQCEKCNIRNNVIKSFYMTIWVYFIAISSKSKMFNRIKTGNRIGYFFMDIFIIH